MQYGITALKCGIFGAVVFSINHLQRTASVTKLVDPFKRTINYLRISITDRCNLRCIYCMPPEGVVSLAHDAILSYEEIAQTLDLTVPAVAQRIRRGKDALRREFVSGKRGSV